MEWSVSDIWIVLAGSLSAASCALLGCYLVLKKMSMMGDAISHAVLPGLAVAFLVAGTRDSFTMFVGAAIAGVFTAAVTQWIHSFGKVDEGSSMGVVFTTLFAIGLILIVRAADSVDLDPGCVLYGTIELVPLDIRSIFGVNIPAAVIKLSAVLLINIAFILIFYKELKISTFDPALSTTLGINARLMHYLLMTLVAMTTVASFESVGSILVVAMLIVPAATAHLITDRLSVLLLLSGVFAVASSFLGHLAAVVAPTWFGFDGVSTSTAGMMAVVSGCFFLVAVLVSPRYGVISRMIHQLSLSLRIVREDVLGLLYRVEEPGRADPRKASTLLREVVQGGAIKRWLAVRSLRKAGKIVGQNGNYQLTPSGRGEAIDLIRSHRLWESYLAEKLSVSPDSVHEPAERMEHFLTEELREHIAADMEQEARDPHGKEIPSRHR